MSSTTQRKCSIRSAKAKACRLQNKVRDAIRADNPDLDPADVTSAIMGSSGADIVLTPAAKRVHPYSYEAKAHANGFAKAYAAIDQANRNDGLTPVAVVQHDRAKPLAILHLDDLRELQRLARWARQNGCSLTS
ncbi:hypothetical protein ACH0BU_11860 [Sphingomonas olei]